jgi:hypothetical protein
LILLDRGAKVVLDGDLAQMYGTTTKRLDEQVRRNVKRFPPDFMFELTDREVAALRSQDATSKRAGRGGRRYLPLVFTEQGVSYGLPQSSVNALGHENHGPPTSQESDSGNVPVCSWKYDNAPAI